MRGGGGAAISLTTSLYISVVLLVQPTTKSGFQFVHQEHMIILLFDRSRLKFFLLSLYQHLPSEVHGQTETDC